jgi:GNAT superfamily N-acetyltransferase
MDFDGCPDVRLAVPDDLTQVMELMELACAEDAQHKINREKVLSVVLRHYSKQGAMLAVIGEPGNPVAYVLSIVDPVWYSDDYQILELSLFVHPDHRRTNFAKQLMNFMKQASEGLSLDLTIGVFHHEKTEAKIRLYQRQFGPQIGAYFCYTPQHG